MNRHWFAKFSSRHLLTQSSLKSTKSIISLGGQGDSILITCKAGQFRKRIRYTQSRTSHYVWPILSHQEWPKSVQLGKHKETFSAFSHYKFFQPTPPSWCLRSFSPLLPYSHSCPGGWGMGAFIALTLKAWRQSFLPFFFLFFLSAVNFITLIIFYFCTESINWSHTYSVKSLLHKCSGYCQWCFFINC